ncbi:hypothetical protein HA44_01415 [Mixta gaviniae]|nr:hypothetical protein HA44_01415 [Mixta gaviniae]
MNILMGTPMPVSLEFQNIIIVVISILLILRVKKLFLHGDFFMKLLNYIVRFPFPDWSELTDNDGKLIKKPICYCWLQMGEDKEVTYGFDNEIASDFLKTLFPKFLMVDEIGVKECLFNKLPLGEICFYDDGEKIEMLKKTFF